MRRRMWNRIMHVMMNMRLTRVLSLIEPVKSCESIKYISKRDPIFPLPWSPSTISRVCIWLLQVSLTIVVSQTVGRICDIIMIIVIIIVT